MKDLQAIVLNDVMKERVRQDAKWGVQDHEPARYLMILGEEFGEACQAGCDVTWPPKNDPYAPGLYERLRMDAFRKELIHTAAVAVAMIEAIDRKRIGGAP